MSNLIDRNPRRQVSKRRSQKSKTGGFQEYILFQLKIIDYSCLVGYVPSLLCAELSHNRLNGYFALSSCPSNWTVSVSLYIERLYSCQASIACYVRDFANIQRFSRFLRFATSLALLKLRNLYITPLLITVNNK